MIGVKITLDTTKFQAGLQCAAAAFRNMIESKTPNRRTRAAFRTDQRVRWHWYKRDHESRSIRFGRFKLIRPIKLSIEDKQFIAERIFGWDYTKAANILDAIRQEGAK